MILDFLFTLNTVEAVLLLSLNPVISLINHPGKPSQIVNAVV